MSGNHPSVDRARCPRMGRALAVPFLLASFACCARAVATTSAAAPTVPARTPSPSPVDVGVDAASRATDAALLAAIDAGSELDATLAFDDPMALHQDAPAALRALMGEA